jgi:hypothetical protein
LPLVFDKFYRLIYVRETSLDYFLSINDSMSNLGPRRRPEMLLRDLRTSFSFAKESGYSVNSLLL